MTERPDDQEFDSVARRCARGVRGCATDEQYRELVDRIVQALRFARYGGGDGEKAVGET